MNKYEIGSVFKTNHVIKIHREVHIHIGEAIAIPSESEVIRT